MAETGDVVNGGTGTDTLQVRNAADGANPTLNSIEKVYVRLDGANSVAGYSLAGSTGLTEVWADRVEDTDGVGNGTTLTLSGFGKAVTLGVVGAPAATTASGGRGNTTFTLNDVTGTADTASLVVDSAKAATITIAGVETLNVKAQTGASSLGSIVAAAATKVVLTGDQALTLGTSATAATLDIDQTNTYTVDASAMTGALRVTLEDQAAGKKTTFTGGSGNDKVYLGTGLDADDSIDGGAGTNTIGLTDAADLTATTGKVLKNFQIFDAAAAAAGTYDMSLITGGGASSTITGVVVSADVAGATVIDKLAVGGGVTINATTSAALTVNQAGQADAGRNSDTLSFSLTAPATGGNITAASLVTASVETINVASNETAGVTTGHTITATTFAGASTVKFTGNEQLTVTTLGATAATNIDASGMTDKFIMTNASDAATVLLLTGGSAADTLKINSNVQLTGSVVVGGAGGDTIDIANSAGEVTTVKYAAQADSTATAYDKVTGLVTTEDKVDLKAFAFDAAARSAFDNSAKVTTTGTLAAGTLAFSVSSANATGFFSNAGANRAVAIEDTGTDNIIFVDVNKDGNYTAADDLVIVVGAITGATSLVTGDFVFV